MEQTILTQDNFTSILSWLSSESASEPESASAFLETLTQAYEDRRKKTAPTPRRRRGTTAAVLSLSSFLKQIEEDEKKKAAEPKKTVASLLIDPADPPFIPDNMPENPDMKTTAEVKEDAKPSSAPTAENEKAEKPSEAAAPAEAGNDPELPLVNEEGYTERGMDSVTIARAIIHLWDNLDPNYKRIQKISSSFIQTVLYITYGTWLSEKHERLIAEHPQMWKYGPVFARAYSHLKKEFASEHNREENRKAYEAVKQNATLKEFLDRTVRTNACKNTNDITKPHVSASSAWGRCLKANPEKWSTPIPDKNIDSQFTRTIKKSRK